ncbi:hypothetical protein TIFTF001_040366 [Ficus carica]|uniref:Uncharacterized protein n=1 Tax=Ficus carica TaxID=3494 RepID=A0AA87ZB61_FICCA|nr:hypothetical protein TIFTF001_040366 [Ficus carica]
MFSFLTLRLKVAEAVEWTGALWLVDGNGGFAAWLTAQKNKAKRKWERRKQNFAVAIPQHFYADCSSLSPDFAATLL